LKPLNRCSLCCLPMHGPPIVHNTRYRAQSGR
jgi:hypothetical protein